MQRKARIKAPDAVNVGGHYRAPARSGTEHDRCVHHIAGPSRPAGLARSARQLIVKRLDVDAARPEEADESDLPPSVAPDLRQHARRRRSTGRAALRTNDMGCHSSAALRLCNPSASRRFGLGSAGVGGLGECADGRRPGLGSSVMERS